MPALGGDMTTDLIEVVIASSEMAADGIRQFELRRADGGDLPVFTPGAHVEVQVPTGVLRKYSLCNDPVERDRYVIAVKREDGGRGGSISLVDGAKTGDTLFISSPRNDF